MTDEKLVSIILPTHNREALLDRAVKSVFSQTYRNWELIIVDDNSSDSTQESVKAYLRDKRVTYLKLNNGAGGAEARNIGLRKAVGVFIAFLDDDDQWMNDKLSKQIPLFAYDDNTAIVSCDFTIIDEFGTKRSVPRPEIITINDMLYDNFCGSFSFCVVKRDYLRDLEIDRKLTIAQDWDLWNKILMRNGLNCRVHPDKLVNYYVHKGARLTDKTKDSYLSFLLFLRKYFRMMNVYQQSLNLAYLTYFKHITKNHDLLENIRYLIKILRLFGRSKRLDLKKLSLLLKPVLHI
ncbi:MAG: hypothetical protein A2204_05595 [Elusimicrobia bacterium RIFOXYA1_FULL_47_7]|nr:MAG: hypothetical protein A2278_01750 [Elusimicrobia bacterium RIFOXYA12_FULL_49_49]OGS07688.1 MAG: hypothetical protein A2204_05595 [Elusimicrobia bacterium RIFOXYA1_FULL_47_7]OGS11662.1 MAG: hypothetical protein A2386_03290 [Elusimicrobia bacterium RIFOXYB1_FULL_48_9]OGS16773.1 MAG: hypothetical protein A2251_05200 [Elusimicrobia bacterium RIFOXYA2_FULL_47_53]OGS32001.1 MAG: hypothetical protein A2323_07975 [Elusimicrobia bacterium RIFOXYB2_FULL_46_23]